MQSTIQDSGILLLETPALPVGTPVSVDPDSPPEVFPALLSDQINKINKSLQTSDNNKFYFAEAGAEALPGARLDDASDGAANGVETALAGLLADTGEPREPAFPAALTVSAEPVATGRILPPEMPVQPALPLVSPTAPGPAGTRSADAGSVLLAVASSPAANAQAIVDPQASFAGRPPGAGRGVGATVGLAIAPGPDGPSLRRDLQEVEAGSAPRPVQAAPVPPGPLLPATGAAAASATGTSGAVPGGEPDVGAEPLPASLRSAVDADRGGMTRGDAMVVGRAGADVVPGRVTGADRQDTVRPPVRAAEMPIPGPAAPVVTAPAAPGVPPVVPGGTAVEAGTGRVGETPGATPAPALAVTARSFDAARAWSGGSVPSPRGAGAPQPAPASGIEPRSAAELGPTSVGQTRAPAPLSLPPDFEAAARPGPVTGQIADAPAAKRTMASTVEARQQGPEGSTVNRLALRGGDGIVLQPTAAPEPLPRPGVGLAEASRVLDPTPTADGGMRGAEPSGALSAASTTRLAAAPPAPALPLPMAQSGWEGGLQERILWISAQNLRGADIQLDPPELGPLQIQISSQREGTTVHFATHSHLVRDLIEQSLPRLREMLDAGGLRDVSVDVSQQGRGEQRQSGGYPAPRAGAVDVADEGAREQHQTPWLRAPVGLVDDYA